MWIILQNSKLNKKNKKAIISFRIIAFLFFENLIITIDILI